MVSVYPAELATVSVALDLLEADSDPRIGSAEESAQAEAGARLLEAGHDPPFGFHLYDGTYYIANWIEDGKSRLRLRRISQPPS